MLKAKDIRDQTIEEIEANLRDLNRELFDLLNERQMNKKSEKPHLLREKRRDRARMLTVLKEKRSKTQV